MELAMRRREQEVWQACDDLWALHGDTKHLTGDAIRERLLVLGKSKGSPNEIYKYRKSWSLSRRIESDSGKQSEENDPISRAVRMVHEKLLSETDEKIEELKTKHATELREKHQELELKQRDLKQVITEFGIVESALTKAHSELKELQQLMAAEIEIRQAIDRELLHTKSSHQKILEELKVAHKDTLLYVSQVYAGQELQYQALIKRLEEEKKTLGFEFSEKITEIKTTNHSQALVIKNQQLELESIQAKLEEKNGIINTQSSKLKIILEEFASLRSLNQDLAVKIALLQAAQTGSQRELRQMHSKLKKNEVTIARLRVTRALVGEQYERGITTKKSAAPRTTLSHETCGLSLQDSCSQ